MQKPAPIPPGPGQESVWDYPRPPRLEASTKRIRIIYNGVVIADSTNALRVLETSHPPVYYIPPADIQMQYLTKASRQTFCEFKGAASYYNVAVNGASVTQAGWYYPQPSPGYTDLANYVAFYPSKMEACYIDEEQVTSQPGDFYGGWITQDIVGPFKGDPGTLHW